MRRLIFLFLMLSACSQAVQAQQTIAVKKATRLYQEDEFERCIAFCSRKLRVRKNQQLYELRGLSYEHTGEPEKAVEDYKQSLTIAPDDTAYQAVGITYYRMENYPEALQWIREGLEHYPRSVTLWLALATVTQRAADDWQASLPLYEKTAELDGTGRFYSLAGGVCWTYGEYGRAVEYASRAIALEPEEKHYYRNRGQAYRDGGWYEEAVADYLKAIELDPENAFFWHELAQAYYFQGDQNRKRSAVERSDALGYGECLCIIH